MEIFRCWLKLVILVTLVLENVLIQAGEGMIDMVLGFSAWVIQVRIIVLYLIAGLSLSHCSILHLGDGRAFLCIEDPCISHVSIQDHRHDLEHGPFILGHLQGEEPVEG